MISMYEAQNWRMQVWSICKNLYFAQVYSGETVTGALCGYGVVLDLYLSSPHLAPSRTGKTNVPVTLPP